MMEFIGNVNWPAALALGVGLGTLAIIGLQRLLGKRDSEW
jgi:hypothetical protein